MSSLLVIPLLKVLDYGAVLEDNACVRLQGDQRVSVVWHCGKGADTRG